MALFFIFSALLGMSLQVTNGYAGPFITSFKGSADALISQSFAANNATLLTSISQVSEALCILMIPFFLKRYGIKVVMLIAMFAWVLRFGFFGIGNPAMPGVIFFILSCIVYGVASTSLMCRAVSSSTRSATPLLRLLPRDFSC